MPEDTHRSGKARHAGREQLLRPPDHKRDVAQDQQDTEGRDQLQMMWRTVDASQDDDFYQKAEQSDQQRRDQYGGEETRGAGGEPHDNRIADIRPQHIERAVGEIDTLETPKTMDNPDDTRNNVAAITRPSKSMPMKSFNANIDRKSRRPIPLHQLFAPGGRRLAPSASDGRTSLPSINCQLTMTGLSSFRAS